MSRKKTIDDEKLIALIDKYYNEICIDSGKPIKLPEVATYVSTHGYPGYQVTTLRRNTLAREHIRQLQENSDAAKLSTLVAFQTLDINDFLEKHKTRASLVAALSARDSYYQMIARNAVTFNQAYKTIVGERDYLKEQLEKAKQDLHLSMKKQSNSLEENKDLKKQIVQLKKVIEHYVKAEVAKAIVENEGIAVFPSHGVSEETIEINSVSAATDIYPFSALESAPLGNDDVEKHDVIQSLYDRFQ